MKRLFKLIGLFLISIGLSGCQKKEQHAISFAEFLAELREISMENRQELVEGFMSGLESTPLTDEEGNVHFILYGKANEVKIKGDLQGGWSKPDVMAKIDCGYLNFFYKSYQLPLDAQVEYQFLIDGKESLDLNNPRIAKEFEYGDRNVVQMPRFEESVHLAYRPEIPHGKLQIEVFKSQNEEFADRQLNVYLPNDYNEQNNYPVLLVNDGKEKLYTTPFRNIIDNLTYEQLIEPVIVVFVPWMERGKEYCYQDFDYAKVIAEEMVPFITKKYAVRDEADRWGIMGSSMGGNISMVTGFLYPEIIANVGAQGGAGGGITLCNSEKALEAYMPKKERYPLNIFASSGRYDLIIPDRNLNISTSAKKWHQKLDSLKIDHTYKLYNAGHNDSNWQNSIDDILIQFFGK